MTTTTVPFEELLEDTFKKIMNQKKIAYIKTITDAWENLIPKNIKEIMQIYNAVLKTCVDNGEEHAYKFYVLFMLKHAELADLEDAFKYLNIFYIPRYEGQIIFIENLGYVKITYDKDYFRTFKKEMIREQNIKNYKETVEKAWKDGDEHFKDIPKDMINEFQKYL